MSAAFDRMSTSLMYVKRGALDGTSSVSSPTSLAPVHSALPAMPTTPEVLLRYAIETTRVAFVTYVKGVVDVVGGDVIVLDDVEYIVRGVGPWPTDRDYYEIVFEGVV